MTDRTFSDVEPLEEDVRDELGELAKARRFGRWRVASKRNDKGELVIALIIDDRSGETSIRAYEDANGDWSFVRPNPSDKGRLLLLRPGFSVGRVKSRCLIFGPLPTLGLSIASAIQQGVAVPIRESTAANDLGRDAHRPDSMPE